MTTRPEITLTHLDEAGAAYMVDVTAKTPTVREARATAFVACSEAIVDALRGGQRGHQVRTGAQPVGGCHPGQARTVTDVGTGS